MHRLKIFDTFPNDSMVKLEIADVDDFMTIVRPFRHLYYLDLLIILKILGFKVSQSGNDVELYSLPDCVHGGGEVTSSPSFWFPLND
jgi:hypothetical protein